MIELDFIREVTLITAVTGVIIGALIYTQQPKKPSTLIFFILTVVIALFFILNIYFYGANVTHELTVIILMYTLLMTAVLLMLLLSLTVCIQNIKFTIWKIILIVIPYIVSLLLLTQFPEKIVMPVIIDEHMFIHFGVYFYLYALLFGIYTIAALYFLINRYIYSAGVFKFQLLYIIVALFIMSQSLYFGYIIAPSQGVYTLYFISPILILLAELLIGYAMAKYNQLNIKYLGTQMFIILLLSVLFFELVTSVSAVDQLINGAVIIAVSFSSYYLIRNIRLETNSTIKMNALVKELANVNEDLRVLDDRKSEFLIMTAHHFKGPLTLIKGYASMLIEGSYGKRINKKASSAIGKIFNSSNRLVTIIDDFMDISNIESGEMNYAIELVDMRELVEEVIEEVRPNIKKSNLKFSFKFDKTKTFVALVDKGKLRQVISNLIDNSIKYTLNGNVKVSISKEQEGKVVRIAIKDTGVGMNRRTLNKLFKKFSRAKGISKLHTGGSGLGLYVARQILKHHNGRIWAESKGKGSGSQFYIEVKTALK